MRLSNRYLGAWAALGAVVLASTRLMAQGLGDTNWSVAVLDRLLAGVGPGQELVNVGDMRIRVSNLQTWRNMLAGQPTPRLAFDGTAPTWSGGNIYYTFDVSVSAAHQKAFIDGANEWATFANIHFIPRTIQANYVTIAQTNFLGTNVLEGGVSAVGMVGGQQFLSIGPTAWNRPTICHEIGHTLGLVHEHQRSDRDSYVTILTNNITPGAEGNFVLLPTSTNQTAYDFLSIMHYSRNELSSNGLDTIEPLPAYTQYINIMGRQFDPVLSAGDRAGITNIYGAAPPISGVVTNTQDSGSGSLRAALYYGFDNPGATITFNIPTNDPGYSNLVFTIKPTDQLPSLVHATVLDGTTQTNFNANGPAIQLNGVLAPPPSVFPNGLRLGGANCVVRSFIVNGFAASGILIDSSNATGNAVTGCYIGVDPTGEIAATNGLYSLAIDNGASGNTVGGTNAASRNIISGSAYQGLVIRDPGTERNVVEGNYIGLDRTGAVSVSNTWSGVEIFNGAQSNVIGGTLAGMGNVISGNGLQGVAIADTNSRGNVIQGNWIGLDASGTVAVSNGWSGVNFFGGASGNSIGGLAAGAGNVISGNGLQGILLQDPGASSNLIQGNFIGMDPTGSEAIPNGWAGIEIYNGPQGTRIGGSGAGNVISGNGSQGIYVHASGSGATTIQGNLIGPNAAGTAALPNFFAGIQISEGAQSNLVGGTTASARNVISGNNDQGLFIADTNTTGNVVEGNYIGVDVTGGTVLPNGFSGVEIYDGPRQNWIGGSSPGAGNVISGNENYGVYIHSTGTSSNFVQGNYIGLDFGGAFALPSFYGGVGIFAGAQFNLIGGALPGMGNVISGNSEDGVEIAGSNTASNLVEGNYIGLDATGNNAVANYVGVGIFDGAQSNLIGGTLPGMGNVISGNGDDGVEIAGINAVGNLIEGNYIGLDATGANPVANQGFAGVNVFNDSTGNPEANVIGGGPGARNIISGNSGYGIALQENVDGHLILGNTIGLNASGAQAVPNAFGGILLAGGAYSNFVGGTSVTAANLIADNSADGVLMAGPTTTNNSVRGNSIFGNNGLGIHLQDGANNGEAAPGLAAAVLTLGTAVTGSLTNPPGEIFHLDFYASPPPLAGAQAMTYIGTRDVVIGPGGTTNFAVNLAVVPIGYIITATATDPVGNTSPLSSGVTVTATDSVGDGIPNAWRAAYFGGNGSTTNSQSCATCDPSGDGMNNLEAFLAGINPTNSADALELAVLRGSGTDMILSFQSAAGIAYRIDHRYNLFNGDWYVLADEILGIGGPMQITDPGVGLLPGQFYRLIVEP